MQAGANLKILIPANPGGGWDTTGRALGKAMLDAKQASTVTYDNKGGAAGALGLAPFLAGAKGDANQMMVMGAVMLGGLITLRPDHEPFMRAVREAMGEGRSAVVVHPYDAAQRDAAEAGLKELSGEVLSTL